MHNSTSSKTNGKDSQDHRELYERVSQIEAQLKNMPTKSDLHMEISKAVAAVEDRVNKRWYQFVTWGLTVGVGVALYFRPF